MTADTAPLRPSGDTTGATDTANLQAALDARHDELEDYLAQLMQSSSFARAYHRAQAAQPGKLCIDGREYARRQKSRRRRRA